MTGQRLLTLSEGNFRPEAWTRDQHWLLLMRTAATTELAALDLTSRKANVILSHSGWSLHSAQFSPDDQWIAFHATPSPATRRIFIVPFRGAEPVPESEWFPVTDGRNLDREPRWSPDGKRIYFLSDRDGFRCVWAVAVNAANHQVMGPVFPVYHAHSMALTLNLGTDTGPNGLTILPGKMIVTMAENTGNIWLSKYKQ